MNKVILMGRLTADPELKTTKSKIYVTKFNIAINRKSKNGEADFITIVAWNSTAEFIAKYFGKGQLIAIDGTIQTNRYEDQQGNKRTSFEVVAKQVYFAGGNEKKSINEDNDFNINDFEPIDEDDDDLPF